MVTGELPGSAPIEIAEDTKEVPGDSEVAEIAELAEDADTSTADTQKGQNKPRYPPLPNRWLQDIRSRIGKCIAWGLTPEQLKKVGTIMKILAKDWRHLLAGSRGFPISKPGLFRHEVVWGEMDSMGHVNNVTYARYAESARIKWVQNFASYIDPEHRERWQQLWTPQHIGLILKRIEIDYNFPMTVPDRVSVYHSLITGKPSTDSFWLKFIIISEKNQIISAHGKEHIVVYDYENGGKTPLEPFMKPAFKQVARSQRSWRTKNTARVFGLLKQVEELEKETWDKPGAKEDLGSAKVEDLKDKVTSDELGAKKDFEDLSGEAST